MRWNGILLTAAIGCGLCLVVPAVAQNAMTTATATTSQSTPIVDPGRIYNDKQPYHWVGKDVTLKNVLVQDTNDSGNFWVGANDDHRLLIVKPRRDANLEALHIEKGDLVTVSGVVRPASEYMQKKTSAESNSMNDARDSSGVFLMANNITVTSRTKR